MCIKSCSENLDSQFLLKMVHVREPAFVRAHLEFLFYDINSHCHISKEIAGNKIYETKICISLTIFLFLDVFVLGLDYHLWHFLSRFPEHLPKIN